MALYACHTLQEECELRRCQLQAKAKATKVTYFLLFDEVKKKNSKGASAAAGKLFAQLEDGGKMTSSFGFIDHGGEPCVTENTVFITWAAAKAPKVEIDWATDTFVRRGGSLVAWCCVLAERRSA